MPVGLGVNVTRRVRVTVAVCVQVGEREGVRVTPGRTVAISGGGVERRAERTIVKMMIASIPTANKAKRSSWRGFCSGAED